MGLNSANANTPGWFDYRTSASKNIIAKMTREEKKKLRHDRDKIASELEGLSVEQLEQRK